jgi:hypothetical protein
LERSNLIGFELCLNSFEIEFEPNQTAATRYSGLGPTRHRPLPPLSKCRPHTARPSAAVPRSCRRPPSPSPTRHQGPLSSSRRMALLPTRPRPLHYEESRPPLGSVFLSIVKSSPRAPVLLRARSSVSRRPPFLSPIRLRLPSPDRPYLSLRRSRHRSATTTKSHRRTGLNRRLSNESSTPSPCPTDTPFLGGRGGPNLARLHHRRVRRGRPERGDCL